jgi:hypothetical protein
MKKMSLAALAVCFATFVFAQEAVEVKAPEAPKTFTCADCGKTIEVKMPKFNRGPRAEMKQGDKARGPRGPRGEMKQGNKARGPRGPRGEMKQGEMPRGPRGEMKQGNKARGPRGPRFQPMCKECFKAKASKAPVAPVEATPAQ